jgi:hypothetical protein
VILPAHLARLVLVGQKTEHRVPLRRGDTDQLGIYRRHRRGHSEVIQPADWKPADVPDPKRRPPGTRRVFDASGEPVGWERLIVRSQIGRVVFTDDPCLEPLDLLDNDRAQREGFGNFGEFIDHWERWHRREFDPDEIVRVVRFQRDREVPDRQLHQQSDYAPSIDDPPGYTTSSAQALRGELPAVPREWQARHSELRRSEFALIRREQTLRDLARVLGAQVRQKTLAAERAGADITPELRGIQAHLDVIERKLRDVQRQKRAA